MSTATASPRWTLPGGRRPRVVVENADPRTANDQARAFSEAGFDVAVCGGPERLATKRCPLVAQGRCHFAEGTDVMFFDLDVDDPGSVAVLAALQRRYPTLPIVVEAAPGVVRDHPDLLEGCATIAPFDTEKLVTAVSEVAAGLPA